MADEEWERIYARQDVIDLPWYFPSLDSDLQKYLSAHKLSSGYFLDIGTGPGTQAISLAKLGFTVTGTDISSSAISGAKERASKAGVKVNFREDDILETKLPANSFDFIFDRGIFHSLEHPERLTLILNASKLLRKNGLYFLKCFSDRNPNTWRPHRFSKEQVSRYFERDFEILFSKHSHFEGTLEPKPKALFFAMRKKGV